MSKFIKTTPFIEYSISEYEKQTIRINKSFIVSYETERSEVSGESYTRLVLVNDVIHIKESIEYLDKILLADE